MYNIVYINSFVTWDFFKYSTSKNVVLYYKLKFELRVAIYCRPSLAGLPLKSS